MSFADWTRDTANLSAHAPAATKASTVQQSRQAAERDAARANARPEPSWKKTFAFPVYSGLLEIVG